MEVGNFPGEGIGVAGLGLLAAPWELLPGKGIDQGGIGEGWGGQEEADCPALLLLPIWALYVVVGPLVVGVEDAAPRGGRGGVATAEFSLGTTIPSIVRGGQRRLGHRSSGTADAMRGGSGGGRTEFFNTGDFGGIG